MDKRAKRDVQRIAILLTCAVASAGLVAGLMLYHYSPTGRYIAGQTVLDPQVMNQINIQDSPKKGRGSRLVFEKTDFTYYNAHSKTMEHTPVSFEAYQQFYTLITGEKSLENVTDEIAQLFSQPHLNRLVTTMREGENTAAKEFQVVEFSPQDYLRVQLHGDQDPDQWAYFYQPGMNEQVIRLFTESAKS